MQLANSAAAILGLAGLVLLPCGAQAAFGTTKSVLSGQLDMALGLEAMSGETSYAIGGNYVDADGDTGSFHFPISKLEWPLDTWLARLDAGWNFNPAWRLNGTLKTNLSDPDDRMVDKDWLTPGQLDVYSESSISSFDAFIFDMDLEWTFWRKGLWSFYAGAGYQYQNFQYESAMIYQYSPSGLGWLYDYAGDGTTTITYEMTYSMPYALLGSEVQLTPELRLSGSLAVSPLAGAEDEDHHLLRNITAVGDMDGVAYLLDLSGIYYVTPWCFVEAGVHYAGISADGEQNQIEDGVQIEMEAESAQTSGYLNVGYSF